MSARRWIHLCLAAGIFAAFAGLLLLLNLSTSSAGPGPSLVTATPAYTRVYRQGLNGYAGASDVTILRSSPDANFEGQTYLRLHCNDHTRLPEQAGVLIRFDLSDLPRNARVLSATFQLVTFSRSITDDLLVSFHVLSRTWETAEATWNRPRAGETWATPGANDTWYDRREEWESWALFLLTNPPQARYTWDVTQAVQYWVEQPRWNHGAKLLAYIGQRREVRYDAYASEAPYPDLRPQLVVTYTLDPAQPTPTDVPPTPTATPTRRPEGPLYQKTFQQGLNGYFGVSDTYLYRRAPDIAFSESISLHLRWQDKDETGFVDRDESNPLFHFDLRSIPSHALVTSATLYLYAFYQSNPSYLDVTSHRVLRDWDRRLATWRQAAPGTAWYAEGCGAPDHDYQKRESDWVDMPAAGAWHAFNLRDMVQHWVWYPDRNFGLLLKPHVDVNVGYSFYSSEAPTQTLRPKLVVEYWLPADVPTATPTAADEGGPTATPTPSPTPTVTPSSTPTAEETQTPTSTATATPSASPTASPTATSSATPTGTTAPTHTPSPTPTATYTVTPRRHGACLPLVIKWW